MVSKTDMHHNAMMRAEEKKLPVFGHMYRQYGLSPMKEVHVGVVSSTTGVGYIIESRTGGSYQVVVTRKTRQPHERIKLGETILILGPDENGSIEAHGIRPFHERHIKSRLHIERPAAE